MTRLLIDTCVWLDIAKNYKGEKILTLIEEFIDSKEISLVVPRIVIEEFQRNKSDVVNRASKSYLGIIENIKDLVREHASQHRPRDNWTKVFLIRN